MSYDPVPPFRRDFDAARDPYTARNALGIMGTGAGFITSVSAPLAVTGGNLTISGITPSCVMQVFPASGTYTPTAGMGYGIIECVGGGGGGGVASGSGVGGQFYREAAAVLAVIHVRWLQQQ